MKPKTVDPSAPYRFCNTGDVPNAEFVKLHTGGGFEHPDGSCVMGVVYIRTIKVPPPVFNISFCPWFRISGL